MKCRSKKSGTKGDWHDGSSLLEDVERYTNREAKDTAICDSRSTGLEKRRRSILEKMLKGCGSGDVMDMNYI
jgi:hypothetical protein